MRARLFQVVDKALDRGRLCELIEGRALCHDSMDVSRVREIREDMERADARRLQPHFIASFFLEAFRLLGGTVHERESKRYEVKNVPAVVRTRDRAIGRGEPVLARYERITFEKDLIAVAGKPLAAFVCPGHPLLDATIDLVIERYRDLLKRGAVLVDERDAGDQVRALVYLEHSIQDARTDRSGKRRIVSRRMQFVEIDADGTTRTAGPAPYLDYRPPTEEEQQVLDRIPEPAWMRSELEAKVLEHAIAQLVLGHLDEVRRRKEELADKTMAAVKDRLTKEINYWDHRAAQLKEQELAGKVNARLNSGLARQRADQLTARLQKRMSDLEQERKLSPLPPVVLGGAMIVPAALLERLSGTQRTTPPTFAVETEASEHRAMQVVLQTEHSLGYVPHDVSDQRPGYDVESAIPDTGKLRFIEVKGRAAGATTVTITKNEILTALNKPEAYILAVVLIDGDSAVARYIRRPFQREPDFGVTSVNYNLNELLGRGEEPA